MKGRLHHFDEGDMTIQDFIERHAPCMPESTVRTHLAAGRNSARAMLTYRADLSVSQRKGRETQARQGIFAAAKVRFGTLAGGRFAR